MPPLRPLSDPQSSENGRDSVGFSTLVALEIDYVMATLRRLGVGVSDADDLCQEVFLVVMRRFAELDQSRPVRPWLFGIAYRIALAHRRKSGREDPTADLDLKVYASAADSPEQLARTLAVAALDQLPLDRRAVVVLHELDGVDMKEIASELGIPLFTAYSRLRKGRQEFEKAARKLLQIHAPPKARTPPGKP